MGLTYGYEWSTGNIWRWSDWAERSIFIALALMLGYTVFVVVRFSRHYYVACRESCALLPDTIHASQLGHKRLVAELGRGLGTLKSIAAAAPFLGLAGTCYGILVGFYGFGIHKNGGIGSIVADIGGALVTTAAGLIVAIPAAVSYNVVRMCLGKFESSRSSTLLAAAFVWVCPDVAVAETILGFSGVCADRSAGSGDSRPDVCAHAALANSCGLACPLAQNRRGRG